MHKLVEVIRFTVNSATSLLSTVKLGNARFEVPTAVLLKIQLLWDFQLCRRVNRSRQFEGFPCLLPRSVDEGARPFGTSEASQRAEYLDHKRSLEIRAEDVE